MEYAPQEWEKKNNGNVDSTMHEVIIQEQIRRQSREDDGLVYRGSNKVRLSNHESDIFGGPHASNLPAHMIGEHLDTQSSLMFTHMEFNPNRRTTMNNVNTVLS